MLSLATQLLVVASHLTTNTRVVLIFSSNFASESKTIKYVHDVMLFCYFLLFLITSHTSDLEDGFICRNPDTKSCM